MPSDRSNGLGTTAADDATQDVPVLDDWGTTLDGRTGLGVGRSVHANAQAHRRPRERSVSGEQDGVCLDLDEPAGIEESLGLRRRPCP